MEVPEEPLLEDRIPSGFPDDQICNLLDQETVDLVLLQRTL